MTINTTETNPKSYTGDGTTVLFTVPFYFIADGDLRLETIPTTGTALPTPLTITTDYTVSDAGNLNGGSVTMVVAPTSSQKLRITRWVDPIQPIDYVENDSFPAETHERGLDRLTMLIQQMLTGLNAGVYDAGAVTSIMTRSASDTEAWDAESKVISGGATAVAGTDYPTLTQVQSLITSATGTVPTPTNPGQDDYFFVAASGVMTLTAPAASRTALGLGTSAIQDTGIVAGDVVAVQSGVELPALGGKNITGRLGFTTRLHNHANFT